GVFLTPNHVSWADHILIMKDVNGQVQENRVSSHKFFAPNGQIMAAAGKEKYFRFPFFGFILRQGKQVPITNIKYEFEKWYPGAPQEQKDEILNGLTPKQRDKWNKEGRKLSQLFYDTYEKVIEPQPDHAVNLLTRDSLRHTSENIGLSIKDGKLILVYLEGTRSKTGKMQPIKTGSTQIILEHQGFSIPTAVTGTDKLWPKQNGIYYMWPFIRDYLITKKVPPVKLRVKYGAPIPHEEILAECKKEFEEKDKQAHIPQLEELVDLIKEKKFIAFSGEYERFQPVFSFTAKYLMERVNDMLPSEYKTKQVEVKYPK
ncbi:MAG: lysophospholipid acyltransferase family protein, partial [archaeon]